jgi:hypothetical protein
MLRVASHQRCNVAFYRLTPPAEGPTNDHANPDLEGAPTSFTHRHNSRVPFGLPFPSIQDHATRAVDCQDADTRGRRPEARRCVHHQL